MTANRLPNHVTPTNKVFPIVSVACAITSIWDKGVHVRRILQEFGEKISDFFYGQTNEKYKENSRKSSTADRKPITYSRASNFGSKNEM